MGEYVEIAALPEPRAPEYRCDLSGRGGFLWSRCSLRLPLCRRISGVSGFAVARRASCIGRSGLPEVRQARHLADREKKYSRKGRFRTLFVSLAV